MLTRFVRFGKSMFMRPQWKIKGQKAKIKRQKWESKNP